MKKLLVLLFVFGLSSFCFGQNEYSDYENRIIQEYSIMPDDLLWRNKEYLISKAHNRQIAGTIFLGPGVTSIAYGLADAVINKRESSYTIMGAGIALTVVGAILNTSSHSQKRRVIWIEKELHRRSKASLSAGITGVRLTF